MSHFGSGLHAKTSVWSANTYSQIAMDILRNLTLQTTWHIYLI